MDATESSTIRILEVDPYKSVDYLGHGSYGYVDKVHEKLPKSGSTSAVYARKSIRITREWNREALLRSAQNEFKILNRLKHEHIVRVLEPPINHHAPGS